MAAEVEVQTGEVGRTVMGGRLHLSPLADSSNSLMGQSHLMAPEPNKPVPGPKPRLTPKPFALDKNLTLRPIVAPKPLQRPRSESTLLPGPKPLAPCSPNPVPSDPERPSSTSFKPSNRLLGGQTSKPVVHPFKPAPPLASADLSQPAERLRGSSLAHSHSLRKPPAAAEWTGTKASAAEKERSITRAKSMGFLSEVGKDEEDKAEAAAALRPQPRTSRPRPVSELFLHSPTKASAPAQGSVWAGRRPLSADLTAKFESIGLSLHRKSPQTKENASEEKVPAQEAESQSPWRGEEVRADSTRSRISHLLESQPGPEPEPPVGVKQLIRQLTEDMPPAQSPASRSGLKPRPLPLDRTKRFSSERLPDLSAHAAERHHVSSSDAQRGVVEATATPAEQDAFVDPADPQGWRAFPLSVSRGGQSSSRDVQRVRVFENVVEKHNVQLVDDGGAAQRPRGGLSQPSVRRGRSEDDGSLVTATYVDCLMPSSPLRAAHAFDTVKMEESRAVSEDVPPAQREDKALTLRSRRSEGKAEQPRYLRVGALQKWPSGGPEQEQEPPLEPPEAPEEQLKAKATYFALTGKNREVLLSPGRNPPPEEPVAPTGEVQVELQKKNAKMEELEKERQRQMKLEKQELEEKQRALRRQKQLEVEKQLEREKQRQRDEERREMQRMKELQRQQEVEMQRQKEMEMQRQRDMEMQRQKEKEMEMQRQRDMEMQRQKEKEMEMQRQRDMEMQTQREMEMQRQKEMEMQRQRDMEMQRQKEIEMQRQRDMEMQRQKEKEMEMQRQRDMEMQTQREMEMQRQKEMEMQRQRDMEMQKEIEMQRQRDMEMQRQREMEMQRQKEMEMQRQRDMEMQKEIEMQRQRDMEMQKEIEMQRQRDMEMQRQRDMEMQRQKEMEMQRQRDMEMQRQRDEERRELQRMKELQRQKEVEMQRQRDEEMQRQKEMEMQRQRDMEMQRQKELEKKRLREQKMQEEAERLRKMAIEQEMLRLREIEKEKERQKEAEREQQREVERQRQRELEREHQRQLDMERQEMEKQKLRQREQEKEKKRLEEMERIKETEKRHLLEVEKQKQAERAEQERQRLREEVQRVRQRQQELQDRQQLKAAALRPAVVDLDSVLRDQHLHKAAGRWKEPAGYKPAILDLDAFSSQNQGSPPGAKAQSAPERDISWKVPSQTAVAWTLSPQDPWELQPVEMSVDQPPIQPAKQAVGSRPEQLLSKHQEQLQVPQRSRSTLLDENLLLGPFAGTDGRSQVTPAGVPLPAAELDWLPRELQPQQGWAQVPVPRRSQGSQELSRLRSRSMSRRSAPPGGAAEASLSRMRSRSAHREQERPSRVQQKQNEGEDVGETLGRDTDSQYGTWETGLQTEDSLSPLTPSSDSHPSPSPRKATPPHTPADSTLHLENDTVPSSVSPEVQRAAFTEAPPTLLDTSVLRSRAQLAKKRAPRTRPSRAARKSSTLAVGDATEDWLFRDSTETKVSREDPDSDSEELTRGPDSGPAVSSQPPRVALFPGVDASALKAQLKKRADSDNHSEGPAVLQPQPSRSPKSPFLPRAARVLPPAGGKENGEEDSPQWLKELKSKKRLSQYDGES